MPNAATDPRLDFTPDRQLAAYVVALATLHQSAAHAPGAKLNPRGDAGVWPAARQAPGLRQTAAGPKATTPF